MPLRDKRCHIPILMITSIWVGSLTPKRSTTRPDKNTRTEMKTFSHKASFCAVRLAQTNAVTEVKDERPLRDTLRK